MTVQCYAREADRVADGEIRITDTALDLNPVTGDWVSVTGLTGGIARVRTRARDGSLSVAARGRGGPRPGAWGEIEADVFANALHSRAGYAFAAVFDGARVSSRLETYQGLGVLVVHAFHRYTDDSGRRDYFTREFYVPADAPDAPDAPGAAGAADDPGALDDPGADSDAAMPPGPPTGGNDPEPLLGVWHGLAPAATKSIATLECVRAGHGLVVRAHGVGTRGPVEWGWAPARLYADAHYLDNPPAFLATFEHAYMRVHLQARVNRGVLVVGEYTEFTDGSGRPDYFIRECYRR
ncbi:hypothetical protein GCM10022419_118460 [Nonomuraea rosea]|uniref:Uncharacterized protein n=1 Tax=Nonomuraea rosea TaxID=638574 RepID=A0ABP6ZNU3_9ACTN